MQALVLEQKGVLALRDIDLPLDIGPDEVKIKIHTVGICGSDVHYYTHGKIGPFVVREPMVLGHEASGTVVEVGPGVTGLKPGDRVCMEPGIPDPNSRASKLGIYNVDPSVDLLGDAADPWLPDALCVHPASSPTSCPTRCPSPKAAMVEPFAVGLQAASKARIAPGDLAVVIGAGPIGIMVALAALAGGCSRVIISDLQPQKLAIAGRYPGIVPVDITREKLADVVARESDGWGADVVFEASGSPKAYDGIFSLPRPGGCVVVVGMPVEPVAFDVVSAAAKEIRIETVFRYANVYDRAIAMIASGKVDLKPLISETFRFEESIAAFERAAEGRPADVKLQIVMEAEGN